MSQNNQAAAHTEHAHRDDIGAKMGMWLFLFTELLLFGGMFLAYGYYKFLHINEFKLAAMELDTMMGTINTIILLTSSLTMAMSITAIQKGNKILAVTNVSATIIFALVFMVNKYFEWSHKFHLEIYPGSDDMFSKTEGERMYFGLYYVMTGLHGFHVIVGVVVLIFMLVFLARGKINQDKNVQLENAGLYWHLVDLIWIFLFPLFYLIK